MIRNLGIDIGINLCSLVSISAISSVNINNVIHVGSIIGFNIVCKVNIISSTSKSDTILSNISESADN